MFESIAEDRTSGASEIAARAARELSEAAGSFADSDPGSFWDDLTAACRRLLDAAGDMAPVVNLIGDVLSAAERTVLSGKPADTSLHAVRLEASRVWEFGGALLEDLGQRGSELVADGATVITTSDSGSVRAVLASAAGAGKTFEVILSESRPACEGRGLAEFLGGLDIDTTLVADAALPGLVPESQLVLLGADSVSEESFVNKIGSYALALAARESKVPLYVAAATDKLLPSALRPDPGRPREASELWDAFPESVAVRNRYFEEVPNRFFRALVTEEGSHPPDEMEALLKKRPVPPALLQLVYGGTAAGGFRVDSPGRAKLE